MPHPFYKPITTQPSPKLYAELQPFARPGSRWEAVLRWALLDDTDTSVPRFVGRPVQTSNGFLIGDFVDSNGDRHSGAFWGVTSDFVRNTHEFARYCVANRIMTPAAAEALQRVIFEKLSVVAAKSASPASQHN